jgi:hypothetical protein
MIKEILAVNVNDDDAVMMVMVMLLMMMMRNQKHGEMMLPY